MALATAAALVRCVAAPALARSASLAAQSPAVTKLHIRAHKVCRICGNKDPTPAAGRHVELCRRSSNGAQVLEVQWADGVNARFGAELLRVSSPSAENAASGGPRVRAGAAGVLVRTCYMRVHVCWQAAHVPTCCSTCMHNTPKPRSCPPVDATSVFYAWSLLAATPCGEQAAQPA